IHHRLQVAGMPADRVIFPPRVVRGIYRRTRGIPRLINVLCDRILLGAYGRNKSRADMSMLRLAAREVMGEDGDKIEPASWLRPVLLAAVLLAMCAWWALEYVLVQDEVASLEPVAVTDTPITPQPARPWESPEPEPSAPVEIVETPPAAESLAPAVQPQPEPEPQADPEWLFSPQEGESRLWALNSSLPQPGAICPEPPLAELACVDDSADTWDDLLGLDRPLLLDLVTPERFSATVVLLGMEGRKAWVATGRGVATVDLGHIGSQWTGRYRFLWHPPPGFERPLSVGDSSRAVARVAELFARLDDQPRALTDDTFNRALQQRVRLFQREQGLEDDGVVGVQTLLKLNERLGIDITAADARARLQAESDEVVQR
ncbi:MAG: general secretion pathway protein GspA, partial [Haliea sp.]|nr:general secretion pathway protein GspA [Haliea sp.]